MAIRRDVQGFKQFQDSMHKLGVDDLVQILFRAEKKAMEPMRITAARYYATKVGAWDGKQTDAQASWRWAGGWTSGWTGKRVKGKRDVVHPQGESRMLIAKNILKNTIKPRVLRDGRSVWAKIFGSTNNSWLIEFGRYKDPARAFKGWQIFMQVFNQLAFSVEGALREEVRAGLKRWENAIARKLKNS